MEVKVCKNCRRLFQYITGVELCEDCKLLIGQREREPVETTVKEKLKIKPLLEEEELKFIQVRDYIIANPRDSITKIAEKNMVLPKQLLQWIREERLEFSENSQYAWFECEECGRKIKSGILCGYCKVKKNRL